METVAMMRGVADEVVALQTPAWFFSIGEQYDDLGPISDDEVVAILERSAAARSGLAGAAPALT